MKQQFLNTYSVFVGKLFAIAWNHANASSLSLALLDHYRSVRRRLPVTLNGNHWGNHLGSQYKPWKATQGF
jgi:hypothetical protein